MEIPYIFKKAESFYENRALVSKDSIYAFIDIEGNYIIDPIIKNATYFYNGLAFVQDTSGAVFYIDTLGHKIPEYEIEDGEVLSGNFTGIRVDRKWGLMDRNGQIKIPNQYDDYQRIRHINHQYFFEKEEKWGSVDENNKIIVPFEYDKIENLNSWFIKMKQGDIYDIYSRHQNGVDQIKAENVLDMGHDIIAVQKGSNWWVYNKNNEKVTDKFFDSVDKFEKGYSNVIISQKVFKLDTLGNLSN